ncbi:MAG: glycine zipper 2TM domain-containing protein [Alteraurantiacibacter sp.]
MPNRPALLVVSALSLGIAAPVAAQHHADHVPALEPVEGTVYDDRYAGLYEGEWEGAWEDENTWHGEWTGTYTDAEGRAVDAAYRGVFIGEHRFVSEDGRMLSHDEHGWREHHRGGHRGPRLAYTRAERNQWLMDCQYLMADGGGYYDDYGDYDDDNGALVGGLLGAVAGGIAGNRIGAGDRLLGTVIGAGVGGVAGAAIGSVLDGDGDGRFSRNELWAARYCEAYLRRHELGGGEFAYGQRVAMVPASSARRGHHHRQGEQCNVCREVVTEEWVDIEAPAPRPHRARRVIHRQTPAPVPRGKRQRAD